MLAIVARIVPAALSNRPWVEEIFDPAAALAAARLLLTMHEDAGGFELAPGAHAALDLDIMSGKRRLVGAEVFGSGYAK